MRKKHFKPLARITIDLPLKLHEKIKFEAINNNTSMRSIMIKALEKELKDSLLYSKFRSVVPASD